MDLVEEWIRYTNPIPHEANYFRNFARWAEDKIKIELCIKESEDDCNNCKLHVVI